MTLNNWKNIKLSTNVDDIRRNSLTTDATVSNPKAWRLGQTVGPTWKRYTNNVIPVDTHRDSDAFLNSLNFNK